jgi:hypothetical protein
MLSEAKHLLLSWTCHVVEGAGESRSFAALRMTLGAGGQGYLARYRLP